MEKIIELNKYYNKFEYMRIWNVLDILNNSIIEDKQALHNNIFVIKFFELLDPDSDESIYDTMVIPDYDGTDYKKAFFEEIGIGVLDIKKTHEVMINDLRNKTGLIYPKKILNK